MATHDDGSSLSTDNNLSSCKCQKCVHPNLIMTQNAVPGICGGTGQHMIMGTIQVYTGAGETLGLDTVY